MREEHGATTEHLRRQEERLQELQRYQIELRVQNEELNRANAELELARNRYADLFEFAPIGYMTVSSAGMIEEVNATFCTMLGAAKQVVRQRRLTTFVVPEQRTHLAAYLQRALGTSARQTFELQFERRDGSRFTGQLECECSDWGAGAVRLCRLAVIDISVQKAAQQEVLQLNETLEERVALRTAKISSLNRELEQLTTTVAQDLIAPLRRINGFVHLLQQDAGDQLDEHQRRHLEHIDASASRVQQLTEALLSFARSSSMQLRLTRVDLNRVLNEAKAATLPLAAGREVRIESDALPTTLCDSRSLQLIFTQLLSNALKFTRGVPVTRIRVGVEEDAQEYLFCVRDNGVGFNMRYRERLFGLFRRLHSERDFEGLGLGLITVRRIAERYGGRVWASSNQEGAVFWFSLPKQPAVLD